MLNEIRNWNVDAAGLDQTVATLAMAKLVRAEFDTKNVTAPEWLDSQIRALNRAIEALTRDQKELRRRELLAQASQLETASEKRARIQAELDALEKEGVGK